jgi:NADH-quinone oxidoreductase subunit N
MNIDFTQLAASFSNFLPEIALGSFFVIALLIDAFVSGSKRVVAYWALLGFVAAGALALGQLPLTRNPFLGEWIFKAAHQPFGQGMLVVDGFAIFFKVLIASAGVLVAIFSLMSRELEGEGRPRLGEYYALMLAMTFGMFLMVGANDMLAMYLGIEIVSLSSYAIVGFVKKVPRASEASMKYVIYGGVSSGIMLFGISLVYGLIGTTNFGEIMDYLGTANMPTAPARPLLIASVMILVGLGYKISAAPFHFWAPDVYEGAPITMTAFLSVASKAAGFALLARFIITSYPATLQGVNWAPILAVLAVLTMTIGNLTALQQSNLKRLLAYSSIAHAGYMLMGLVVWTGYGVTSVLFYLAVYAIMNLGAFFAVQKLAEGVGSEDIDDLRGLGPRIPLMGVFLGIFMISLVGLPPTAGFIGKLFLFNALLSAGKGYIWLAVIGAINSVISLYYYLRVLKVLYLDKPVGEPYPLRFGGGTLALLGLLAAATILLVLPNFFGPLLTLAQNSLGTLARMVE